MLSLSSLKINLYNALMSGASGYALSLDLLSGTLDNRVTFSRGTNATLVDATGKITYAPNNLLLRSEEFDNAVWAKTNSTVTANTTVAPNGTTTADTITDDATSGQHQVTQSISVNIGSSYTLTTYVKAGTARYARMALGGTLTFTAATFDLQLGIVQTGSATITAVGNNWFRISISSTASSSGSGSSAVGITNATGTLYSGTGGTLFLWGAQLEQVTYQTTPSTYVATTTAAYYGPRFDYDPVTLAPKGLLIEEQRTNLLLQSSGFNTGDWLKGGATVTANALASPSGAVDADLMTAAAGTFSGVLRVNGTPTITSATAYTLSVFIKKSNWRYVGLRFNTATFGASEQVPFYDFDTDTVSNGGVSGATVSRTLLGNGWVRLVMTFTSTSTTGTTQIWLTDASGATATAKAGGEAVYVWGAQLEAGSFATSYIPTVASTVTRNADNASMTGTNFSSWYNQSEGTLFADVSPANNGSYALAATDGTANEEIVLRYASTGTAAVIRDGGVIQANFGTGVLTGKNALAYKINDFAVSTNGGAAATDTSGTIPTNDQIRLGAARDGTLNINGHIRQIAYYNTRLSDAQLQTLTQPDATLSLNFISSIYEV